MRLNRTLLGWGVFLVLLGAIPLAVRHGLLNEAQAARAWTLWPLLLIAAGIGLLLRRTRLEFAGGLLSAATFGIIGGGLIASGGIPFAACGDERGSAVAPVERGQFGATASVEVHLDCGKLTIDAAAGTAWTFAPVELDPDARPQIVSSPTNLEIRSPERRSFSFMGERGEWALSLPTAPTIELTASVNAGEARLRLPGAQLGRLELTLNAGNATLDLGTVAGIGGFELQVNAGEAIVNLPNLALRGSIGANAAAVQLCAPARAALRMTVNDNITASNNFAERGLVKTGEHVWETPSFAQASVRLEIDADVNAGSLNLEPQGSCGG